MMGPARQHDPRNSIRIGVAAFHLAAYVLLVFRTPYVQGLVGIAITGFLLGQCSLVAIYCLRLKETRFVPFIMPWIAAVVCWYGIFKTFYWGLGDPDAARWAILIVIQVATIIVGVRVAERIGFKVRGIGPANKDIARARFQFPILSLILWTTVFAFALFAIRIGQQFGIWSGNSIAAVESLVVAIVGVMLGLAAILCANALSQERTARVYLWLSIVAVSAVLFSWLFQRGIIWSGLYVSVHLMTLVTLFSAHAFCIAVTLAFTDRLCRPASLTG